MLQVHPHQSHTFKDGTKFTLRGDNILVRKDPEPTMAGEQQIIHMPGNAAEHPYNCGTILAFGTRELKNGTRVPLSDELGVGLKCMFIRYLAEQETNKEIKQVFEPDVLRLRMNDIIVVFAAEDQPVVGFA